MTALVDRPVVPALLAAFVLAGGCPRDGAEPSPAAQRGSPALPARPPPSPAPIPAPGGPLRSEIAPTVRTCATLADLPGSTAAREASEDDVEAHRDLVYAPRADGRDRHLDLYLPADRDPAVPTPVVLLLHGGSWSGGDEDGLEDRARRLAARGFAVAAVRYRLASGMTPARFPAQVADARCAARFTRGVLAPRFRLDPGRVLAGGYSAGGHLAAMLAVGDDPSHGLDDDCPHQGHGARIQGAFAWYAPLDLRSRGPTVPALERIVANFLGGAPAERPDRARRASPVVYVDADVPPMLLVHGEADDLVPVEHSRRLAEALGRAEAPHALVTLPSLGHGFRMFGGRPPVRRATCATVAFLEGLTTAAGFGVVTTPRTK